MELYYRKVDIPSWIWPTTTHLHNCVGADDPLAELLEPPADLLAEDAVPVVDGDPAQPPPGHEVPLGQSAAAQHGHSLGQAGDRHIFCKEIFSGQSRET